MCPGADERTEFVGSRIGERTCREKMKEQRSGTLTWGGLSWGVDTRLFNTR